MVAWLSRTIEAVFHWTWRQLRWLEVSALPWVTLIFGGLLLTVPEQTRDLLIAASEPLAAVVFAAAAFIWSFCLWYWARWGVTLAAHGRHGQGFVAVAVPRVIASAASACAAYGAARAKADLATWLAVGAALGIVALAWARTRMPEGWVLRRDHLFAHRMQAAPKGFWGVIGDDLAAAPFGKGFSVGLLAVALVVQLALAAFPVTVGAWLNAPVAVLLALACLTSVGAFVTRIIAVHTRIPALTICVISVLAIHLAQTERRVRHLAEQPPARREIGAVAEAWLTACAPHLSGKDGHLHVTLIGTAGGASRAAAWTLGALHALTAQDPMLAQRTFAVSSVSGGSLGAALWVAMLARDGVDCTTQPDAAKSLARDQAAFKAASGDFITPTISAMIARDIVYASLVPFNLLVSLTPLRPADRAVVLEHAWEANWPLPGPNLMEGALDDLWQAAGAEGLAPRPLLLLNGTLTGTGLPVVTAPIRVAPESFPATGDAQTMIGGPVRLSTAVSDSARFPIVSTEGAVMPRPGEIDTIADGGYFDNLGASTLINAERALRAAYAKLVGDGTLSKDGALDVQVVQINSDPRKLACDPDMKGCDRTKLGASAQRDLELNELMRCGDKGAPVPPAGNIGPAMDDALAPLLTVIGTQAGHTFHRLVDLNRAFCPHPADDAQQAQPATATPKVLYHYAVLSLCDVPTPPLPLNWVLPGQTLAYLGGRDLVTPLPGADARPAADQCGNAEEVKRIQPH